MTLLKSSTPSLLIKLFKQLGLFFLATVFITTIFQTNLLHFADQPFFSAFQTDSETLVLGGIIADDLHLQKSGWHLGHIGKDQNFASPENIDFTHTVFAAETAYPAVNFLAYKSQYGIQAIFFSKVHQWFRLNKLWQLQAVNSALLAFLAVYLCALYRRIYNPLFAAIFLVTLAGSPWLVAIARNLYWAPYLWFLAPVLAAQLYLTTALKYRALLLLGITFAIFLKSLAGYEYLSTITLLTCGVFLTAPFFKNPIDSLSTNLKLFLLVFVACVVGFSLALLLHAGMRGNTIMEGLQNIIDLDVKRRTYGDPANFDPVYKASLESPALANIPKYVFGWKTSLLLWLPGGVFKLLLICSVPAVLFKILLKQFTWRRDLVLLGFFFMVPTSWFILAKGHSYIHTHINFVLWYLGFVQALIYVCVDSGILFMLEVLKRTKSVTVHRLGCFI